MRERFVTKRQGSAGFSSPPVQSPTLTVGLGPQVGKTFLNPPQGLFGPIILAQLIVRAGQVAQLLRAGYQRFGQRQLVQELLGHANIATTHAYTWVSSTWPRFMTKRIPERTLSPFDFTKLIKSKSCEQEQVR